MAKKNAKVAKTAYQVAAEELNDVLGLKPAIDVTLSDDEILPYIVATLEELDPEDEFTDETQEVIDTLIKAEKKKSKKAPVEEAPAKKGKKTPVVVEEDDDDDDDDDDEEEEEEAPAAPVKKGKKAPVVVEEDDDDDDEEEEEEEEAPAKKSDKKADKKADKKEDKKSDKKADKKEDKPKKATEHATTRPEAIGKALLKKPKTLDAWAKLADEIYAAAGGLSNVSKIKSDIMYMTKTLDVLEVAYPSK